MCHVARSAWLFMYFLVRKKNGNRWFSFKRALAIFSALDFSFLLLNLIDEDSPIPGIFSMMDELPLVNNSGTFNPQITKN